jgi:hypothetical protein
VADVVDALGHAKLVGLSPQRLETPVGLAREHELGIGAIRPGEPLE